MRRIGQGYCLKIAASYRDMAERTAAGVQAALTRHFGRLLSEG
jgi:hypothetical protein